MVEPIDVAGDAQITAARAVGRQSLQTPRAIAARYLPECDRIQIELASGWSAQVPRSFSARLAMASPQDCEQIEIVDAGLGLHWPAIDEDWYVPAIIETMAIANAA